MFSFKNWIENFDDLDGLELLSTPKSANPSTNTPEYQAEIDQLIEMLGRMEYHSVHFPKAKVNPQITKHVHELLVQAKSEKNVDTLLKAYRELPDPGSTYSNRIYTTIAKRLKQLINSISVTHNGYELLDMKRSRRKNFLNHRKLNWALERFNNRLIQNTLSQHSPEEMGLPNPLPVQPKQSIHNPQHWNALAREIKFLLFELQLQSNMRSSINKSHKLIDDLNKERQSEAAQGDKYLANNLVPALIAALEDMINQLQSNLFKR